MTKPILSRGALWLAWLVALTGCTMADPHGLDLPLPDVPLDGSVGPGGGCVVGERRTCECAPDVGGERECISPEGTWSECGCETESTAYVPAPPPEIHTCLVGEEEIECEPYLEESTDYSPQHCCTPEGQCGNTNFLLTGFECVPRGGPPPIRSADCPDESITFIDFRGCCRPDGSCGLTLDETLNNWDSGCVERTEMFRIIDQGFGRKIVAGLMLLDPEVPMWDARSCSP